MNIFSRSHKKESIAKNTRGAAFVTLVQDAIANVPNEVMTDFADSASQHHLLRYGASRLALYIKPIIAGAPTNDNMLTIAKDPVTTAVMMVLVMSITENTEITDEEDVIANAEILSGELICELGLN